MADCIRVRGITAYGHSGVFAEERQLGQRFIVDLDLQMDLKEASTSDNLDDTLDYAAAIALVRSIVEQEQFALIEAMAERIACRLRQLDKRLSAVRVEVHKPQPPLAGFTGTVAVEVWR
ncbi:dihydroneopterin aldolase [Gloeobacter kilaueensis]|uniref:7,8-dihydroneopterin aldolase n=1 Tax=Gloeobacter kilaueensis (strain ATCC BAA-2537 / CCAP 1431/1 / ULC 316 / JS1) TaxID=1183438 RepID=U5QG10_GLOK1|nr:dihydroneopterin aldolase [Gloeobacter kilaueensis]AGY56579.1 dihydroneopterin aldolase [Gloeobacter kilaueensis JS1]